jgi:hypothetical protein
MIQRGKNMKLKSREGVNLMPYRYYGVNVSIRNSPNGLGGIVPKVFVVRDARATTSIPLYKCFTAWKDVRVPFSIRAEGTI